MSNYVSFFFYLFMVGLTVLFASKSQKSLIDENGNEFILYNNKLLFISFLISWFVAGLRYNVGADYFSYIRIYNIVTHLGVIKSLKNLITEPLYALLNYLTHYFFNNEKYIFIITSLLLLLLIYKSLRENIKILNLGMAIFIFMSIYYFPMLTFVRLSIAAAFVFYSYKYLVNKNFLMYTIMIIFATGFHYTAVVMFPVYFLTGYKNKKNFYFKFLIIIIVSIGTIFLFRNMFQLVFMDTKYFHYMNDIGNLRGGINQTLIRLPIFAFIIYYKNDLIKKEKNNNIYIQIFLIGFVISFFSFVLPIADRLIIYFYLSQIILVSQIIDLISEKEKIIKYSIYLYYSFRLFWYLYNNKYFLPYKWIF